MDIKNKTVLVTGGASGLGQATVEAVIAGGGNAVILDINEINANKLIDELGEDKVSFISLIKFKSSNFFVDLSL